MMTWGCDIVHSANDRGLTKLLYLVFSEFELGNRSISQG